MRRPVSVALMVLLLGIPVAYAASRLVHHVDSDHWPEDYDHHFRKYAKRYFGPHFDWRWFKAQGIAESGLNPRSRSSAGARGIMQILPSTYREIRASNPHFLAIEDPRWNIAAALWYDRRLYRKWQDQLTTRRDRLTFTLASYNAGLGAMRRAYRRSDEGAGARAGRYWDTVGPFAPAETRRYVARIFALMQVP
jgi:membrane-bound lytic murein transglycosylase F